MQQRRPPAQRQDQYDQYGEYGNQHDGYVQNGYQGPNDQGYGQYSPYEDQQYPQEQPRYRTADENYPEPYEQEPNPPRTYQYDERYRPNSAHRAQPVKGPLPQEKREAPRERILQEPTSPVTLAWDNPFGVFPPVQKKAKAHRRHASLDKEVAASPGQVDQRPHTSHGPQRPDDFRIKSPQAQNGVDTPPLASPALPPDNMPLKKRVPGPPGPPGQPQQPQQPQAHSFSHDPGTAPPPRPLTNRSHTQPTPPAQSAPFQPPGQDGGYDYNQRNGYGNGNPQSAPTPHRPPAGKFASDGSYSSAPPPESFNADSYRGLPLSKPLSHTSLEPSSSQQWQYRGPNTDPNLNGPGQTAAVQVSAQPQPAYSKPTYQAYSTSAPVDTRQFQPTPSEPKMSSALAEFAFDLPPSNPDSPPTVKSPPISQAPARPALAYDNNPNTMDLRPEGETAQAQAPSKANLLRVNSHREVQADRARRFDLPVMSWAPVAFERSPAKSPIDQPSRIQEGVPMDMARRRLGMSMTKDLIDLSNMINDMIRLRSRACQTTGINTLLRVIHTAPDQQDSPTIRPRRFRGHRGKTLASLLLVLRQRKQDAHPRREPLPPSNQERAQGVPSPEADRGPPVTVAELVNLRESFKNNPNDWALGLRFAKRLVEAASVLASENGRADQKTTSKNRERYIFDAHKVLKKLIASGSPEAMFYLADCYSQGQLGLAPDPKEAFSLYQSAAKLNHPQAAYRVAVCCELGMEDGGGTRRDAVKAMQWYRRAATLGDTPAMYKLGMITLKGLLGQGRNPREAVTWLKRAADRADRENPHALHELGLLYESAAPNDSIIRDERYAFSLFQRAADLGYKYSQFRLGSAWEYGLLGCPIDARQSITWYTRAAAQGEHQSELALSGWYLTGCESLLRQSDREAFLWAQKAASSGLAKAEYAMGYFTEVGIGTAPNVDEARRWYYRAAARWPEIVQDEVIQNGTD
ncbi:hypothetical protein DV735_g2036, partial [Chaetothyriales sp. CBS 134920]